MLQVKTVLLRGAGALVGVVALAALAGCGESGPPRYHVSGMVTHQGEPVPKGSILFQPDSSQGNSGPYGHAGIEDGRFDTRAESGEGVIGGPHVVTIEAFDGSNVNPDLMPHGRSLGAGYRESFDLPEEDTTLEIELTERAR